MGKVEALFETAKKGNNRAFAEVYKLFVQRVFRFIFYMTRNREQAEDLTQNTFLKLWKNISLYDPKRGCPSTYLFTIARNLTIDSLREAKSVNLESAEEIESETNLIEDYGKVETKDRALRILKMLDREERQLVILRFFEDLSFAEIAKILKIKETAARVKVHRVLLKIREKIKWKNI